MDYKASNSAPRTRSGRSMSLDDLFGAAEQEWQEQALCAQTDPEAFFPEKGGSTREAKRICQACAVRDVSAAGLGESQAQMTATRCIYNFRCREG